MVLLEGVQGCDKSHVDASHNCMDEPHLAAPRMATWCGWWRGVNRPNEKLQELWMRGL